MVIFIKPHLLSNTWSSIHEEFKQRWDWAKKELLIKKSVYYIRKEPIRYQAVILLMGGFYQLRVRQKTICKQHNIISYHILLTTAGVVAGRLANAVA